MNILIMAGIALGWGTILADRYIHGFPDLLAILLYGIAFGSIIAGMILRKKTP